MNDKNIDSQSEVILLKEIEHLKRQMTKLQRMLIINRTLSSFDVDANTVIIIFTVIVLVVNGLYSYHTPFHTRIFIYFSEKTKDRNLLKHVFAV